MTVPPPPPSSRPSAPGSARPASPGAGPIEPAGRNDATAAFGAARPKLLSIAYRMLGTMADAEDVVGDVALRWLTVDHATIVTPEAWLVTAVTRRALDVLKSARRQREQYPGVWLPEPVATGPNAGDDLEQTEGLTVGFLLLLERLTPLERAVFVLHDVLDYPHSEVAGSLGRTEAACRQALSRARRHVRTGSGDGADGDITADRRAAADIAMAAEAAQQMLLAVMSGEPHGLLAALAPDVVVLSDGGGVVHAALRPVVGPAKVGRLLANLVRRINADGNVMMLPMELNGAAGFVMFGSQRWAAASVEADAEGRVTRVHVWVNPQKLERLVAALPFASSYPTPGDGAGRFRHRGGVPVRP